MRFLMLIPIFILSACSSKPKSQTQEPATPGRKIPSLTGQFQSFAAESTSNGRFAKRSVRFSPSRYEYAIDIFGDKDLKKPLFKFREEGGYILAVDEKLPEATYNLQLRTAKRYLTVFPSDKKIQRELGLSDCNLTAKQEKDITLEGCGLYAEVADCSEQFDLIQIQKSELKLGQRPADLNICESFRRPSELGPALLPLNR